MARGAIGLYHIALGFPTRRDLARARVDQFGLANEPAPEGFLVRDPAR
ncbi:MAG: hypothetical protein IT318_10145 [Anaerolineales bacterium]|nr:hypothetical protein [Anaerolineales bacterium]